MPNRAGVTAGFSNASEGGCTRGPKRFAESVTVMSAKKRTRTSKRSKVANPQEYKLETFVSAVFIPLFCETRSGPYRARCKRAARELFGIRTGPTSNYTGIRYTFQGSLGKMVRIVVVERPSGKENGPGSPCRSVTVRQSETTRQHSVTRPLPPI